MECAGLKNAISAMADQFWCKWQQRFGVAVVIRRKDIGILAGLHLSARLHDDNVADDRAEYRSTKNERHASEIAIGDIDPCAVPLPTTNHNACNTDTPDPAHQ